MVKIVKGTNMTDQFQTDETNNKEKLKKIGLVAMAILVVIGLYYLAAIALRQEEEDILPGQYSSTWTDLGHIDDTLFFVDNNTLTARELRGGISFAIELPQDGYQIVYGKDRIFILFRNDHLEALNPTNGDVLDSIETKDVDRIEWQGEKLVGYTPSAIRIYDQNLESQSYLPLEGKPIAYGESTSGTLAWIEEGFQREVTVEGEFTYDQEAAFIDIPEVPRNEYGYPIYDSEESTEDAEEVEEASEENKSRYRLSIGEEKDIAYRLSTANQEILDLQWISEDSCLIVTDSYFYIIYQGSLQAQQAANDPASYAVVGNQVALLSGNRLFLYSPEGSKISEQALDFEATKVVNVDGQIYLIGEDVYATVNNGQITKTQENPILFVLENADGSVNLIYENGIQKLD